MNTPTTSTRGSDVTPIHTLPELGAALRARRDADGVTLAELSETLGTAVTTIHRIEHGSDPHLSTVLRICESLGCELVLRNRVME